MSDYQQILNELEKSHMGSVYLLYGEEYLLADKLIDKMKNLFLTNPEREINFFTRYASEDGIDAVINLGAGMSLFSERKLIVLKEVDSLKTTDLERLVKFISKDLEGICFILHTDLSNLYQSKLKTLEDKAILVNLSPLKTSELKQFVIQEFKKSNTDVTEDAIDALLFLVGNHLADLILQINNICLLYSDKKIIDTPEIENIASVYASHDVFQLNNFIGNKDYYKARFALANLMESGISPHQIISQLFRHFSILWKLIGLSRMKITDNDTLLKELRIYRKYLNEFKVQSSLWRTESLISVFKLIFNADRDLKSSATEPQIILDKLSFAIINLK
jgi:DNA polymerase-3 subunit delta